MCITCLWGGGKASGASMVERTYCVSGSGLWQHNNKTFANVSEKKHVFGCSSANNINKRVDSRFEAMKTISIYLPSHKAHLLLLLSGLALAAKLICVFVFGQTNVQVDVNSFSILLSKYFWHYNF